MVSALINSNAGGGFSATNDRLLDDPVVAHIFSFLTVPEEVNARRVCRHFRQVVDDFRTPVAETRLPLNASNAVFDQARMIAFTNEKCGEQWSLPDDGNRLFAAACRLNLTTMMNNLLAYRGPQGQTLNMNCALVEATRAGHLETVERVLVDERCDLSRCGLSVLCVALREGHETVAHRLLRDNRLVLAPEGTLVANWAIFWRRHSVLEALLNDPRIDPAMDDNRMIRFAARVGNERAVARLLVDERVDPTALNNNAVRTAARFGHYGVVDRLLRDERVGVPEGIESLTVVRMQHQSNVSRQIAVSPQLMRASIGLMVRPMAVFGFSVTSLLLVDWLRSNASTISES